MNYRKFGNTGVEISALGFGTMRLPTTDGVPLSANIDEKEAIRLIRHAIDSGVNYVDTAYPYHGRTSETLVGKALADGYREKVYLATKSPVVLIEAEGDFDRILDEQLQKLNTDHVDFYLLHALDKKKWETVKKFNLLDKMKKARDAGKSGLWGSPSTTTWSCLKPLWTALTSGISARFSSITSTPTTRLGWKASTMPPAKGWA